MHYECMTSQPHLKVHHNIPRVWANERTLRFGIDQAVLRLENPTAAQQRLLIELTHGIPLNTVNARASTHGLTLKETQKFLDELQPVLVTHSEPLKSTQDTLIAVLAEDQVSTHIVTSIQLSGRTTLLGLPSAPPPQHLVVVVENYLGDPRTQQSLYTSGTPFLPIRFSDQSILVGPIISELGPCHACVRLWAEQVDPEWRNCALQLIGSRTPTQIPSLVSLAVAFALQCLENWEAGHASALQKQHHITVSHQALVTGVRSRTLTRHALCGCASLSHLANVA